MTIFLQYQDAGGSFVNESGADEYQDAGASFLNESGPSILSWQVGAGPMVGAPRANYEFQVPGAQMVDLGRTTLEATFGEFDPDLRAKAWF